MFNYLLPTNKIIISQGHLRSYEQFHELNMNFFSFPFVGREREGREGGKVLSRCNEYCKFTALMYFVTYQSLPLSLFPPHKLPPVSFALRFPFLLDFSHSHAYTPYLSLPRTRRHLLLSPWLGNLQ